MCLLYGFIVAYASVCFALPRYLRHHGVSHPETQVVAWLAGTAVLLALAGNLYPVPEGPYGKLPLIYLGYPDGGAAVVRASSPGSRLGVGRGLRLDLGIRLREQQQQNAVRRKHAEGCILAVPYLRLPHQEPLAADA
jgi:hypothetical protein